MTKIRRAELTMSRSLRALAIAQLRAHRSAPARPVIGWAPTPYPLVLCPASQPVAPLRYRVEGRVHPRGCGSFRVTWSEWSCDARDGVVEVSGCVDVVSFLSEVVVPVGLEVAVGFDGA